MNMQVWNRRRFFNAVRFGDPERARELLEAGVDPNSCNRRGRPAIIAAVRAAIVDSGVVDALLDAGADLAVADEMGLTALDYARRRLIRLGPGKDRVHRSRSLDEYGNLRLGEHDQAMVAKRRRFGDDAVEMYIQERRKTALRQFMPRRELNIIVRRLEEMSAR